MFRKILTAVLLLFVFAGGILTAANSQADVTGRPHDLSLTNEKGHCINCHDLHQINLGQGFDHNLKRANEIAVCYQCHAGAFNSYSSIDPSYPNYTALQSKYDIRSEFNQAHIHFPLYGMDGEHNKCSYCHNPHGVFNAASTTRKPKLLSAGPDIVTDTDDYCLVCHNNDPNPPHQPFPNISVGSQYRFSRTDYRQMRHSTFFRASTVTEPVPDTARTYDDNPYGNGKDISCLTCHRPHGSPNEHMLKAPDNQDFCLSCHNGTKAPDLSSFNTSGHGKPGAGRICQECHFPHGTGQKAAIKKTITDPHTGTGNTADVNASGVNEACFACHGSAGGSQLAYYSFNSTTAGWTNISLTSMTVDTGTFYTGGGSLKQTRSSAANAYAYSGYVTVQPSTTYETTVFLNLPAGLTGGSAKFMLYEYNAGGGFIKTNTFADRATATNGWKSAAGSFTASSTTTKIMFYLYLTGAGTAYWDEVQLLKSLPATYYQGKAAYNASIHKTSASAHNPNDTGGVQLAGDCDNCHNPHGKGNSYMLVDQDEALCYDCHNVTTPNTVSGRDVQAAFQMPSRHDLTMVKCTNCHNVHNATQSAYLMAPSYPAGTLSDRNTFCMGCHGGTLPSGVTGAPNIDGEWGGGGHNKTSGLSCSDCHESHGSQNTKNLNYTGKAYNGYTAKFLTGMSFGTRSFCEACHNRSGLGYKSAKIIPTGASYVSQHLQDDTTPCSNCHTMKHNPSLGSYTGSSAYYTTACLSCHTQGVGNPYPATDTEFNTPANASDANARRSTHNITYNPPSTVDCVTCHGANHRADHSPTSKVVDPDPAHPISGSLDYNVSSAFCLQCHDSTPVTTGGSTPPNILDAYTGAGHGTPNAGVICSQCHTHHGSVNDKLLRSVINGSAVLTNYSGNNASVCVACHNNTDAALPTWPGYHVYSGSIHAFGNLTTGNIVQDGLHGPGACVNCHNPHGSRVEGRLQDSMLYKNEENLCYRCHASGFDNFSTPGDYNDKWNRFGSLLNIKKEGGALHFGYNSFVAGTVVADGVESLNSFADKDCSITAKIKVKTLSTSTAGGTAQLGFSVYDTKNSSNYTRFFYRGHSVPQAYVVRYTNDGGAGTVVNAFGDESSNYHILKLVRRKSDGMVDAYIDNTLVRTSQLSTSGTFKVQLMCNLGNTVDATPENIEAYFKDFNVSYDDGSNTRNTASGDDVQARFYMKSHHKISDADQADGSKVECFDCHDPHTVTGSEMAYKNISGRIIPIEADQNFCIKCHSASPPQGISFPQGGVWDKSGYDSSAHGNPLKRYKGFGNYSNGVTFACKVCHNPHGSEQSHLQRESWDINRDGIPDDIDGDGILDSADKTGFVGYSTGTRKVMYVNTVTGIPSRSLFERVSTTIPYQANGAIDVDLCLNCHDGSPAPDVEKDFDKISHHDVTYADQVAGGGTKIECFDCHDQHRAQARDDAAGEYSTTNPDAPREPMPGDAKFCLRCHDNSLPPGLSFGSMQLKNIKLSYNPNDLSDANGYDLVTSYQGHFVQSDGAPMMCRVCHNQHGSNYPKMLRDDTEPSKPDYDPSQPIQGMQSVALRPTDGFGGGDAMPFSSPTERCLACHSGGTTFNGNLLPVPPPPDAAGRGFSMSPVGKHPDLKPEVTSADEIGGHIYKNTFAVITTPGSIKDECTKCHDSHDPYIGTVSGELMDCYQCHNENTSLPDVQSEFNDNPTNPTRSKSVHPIKYDPAGTTPAYVECLKCHDQSKHMQGSVRLRKDPTRFDNYTSDAMVWAAPVASRTVNQFCLECHGQNAVAAESFWRGGLEHVPPKLPAAINGAHLTDGNLLCTDCHEYHGSTNNGLRKNAKGDEETFCFSCHGNPANSQNGINIQAKFTGTGTRHNVDASEQAADGSKVECESCHNPHVVTRTSPVINASNKDVAVPSDSVFCVGCHDSSGANGVKFPGFANGTSGPEWDPATGKWNKWNKTAYAGSQHDAAGNVSCKKCHDPHGSPNSSVLLQNISSTSGISVTFGVHSTIRGKRKEELGVNKVCSACHKSSMGVYNGYAGFTGLTFGKNHGVDKNCTYCHNPHGTGAAKLIRATKPLYMNMTSASFGSVYNFKGFTNQTTGAPYYSFCSSRSCHASERTQFDTFNMDLTADNFTRDVTASSHHPLKEGVITCTSCHGEHGSPNAPDLRAPYFRETGWPILWHSGRGVYSSQHGAGCCGADPDPFDGTDFFEAARYTVSPNRNMVTTVSPPSNANDLCLMCHQQDDIIGTVSGGMTGTNTKFLGHEAVKGGALITHNISRDANGVGTDYHNFSCSACHFPHSSSMGKLLKTGCMSQSDNQYPNGSYASIFQCHAYTKWGNYNAGWRNLTTASKTDFKRPPNAVSDLLSSTDPDLTTHLSWTAVADQPGQGAYQYNIYRYSQQITQATKPYAARIYKGVTGGGVGAAMSYADLTGQPNTTYYYAIVACDSENNESLISNSVQVALGADVTPPTAIGDQQLLQVDGTYNVKITWHDPGDNVNVTQYKVYRVAGLTPLTSGDVIEANRLTTVSDTSQSADGSADGNLYTYTDTASQLGQDYSYAVIGFDAAGNQSAVPTASVFSVTIIDPAPAAVVTLTVKPVSSLMSALLSWSAPLNQGTISGYNVYRKAGSALLQTDLVPGNQIASLAPGLTFTDSAVPATGADYFYAVTAVDASSGRESVLGNSVGVNIPAPPTGLAASLALKGQVKLDFSAPVVSAGINSYKIYMRRDAGAWQQAPATGKNLVSNTGFEIDLTGWNQATLTATRDTSNYRSGIASVKLTGASVGDKYMESSSLVAVQPSTSFTWSGYVNVPSPLSGGQTALRIIEYNSTNGYVTEHVATGVTSTSGWQKLTDTWTTSATTTQVRLRVQLQGSGTAYWDDLALLNNASKTVFADLAGLQPGDYDFAAATVYNTYGGTTPYESITSTPASQTVSDTQGPDVFSVSAALTEASSYSKAALSWNAPADSNFSGFTPSGNSYYRVSATYDQGKTWGTVFSSRVLNPNFETFTGTIDDASVDTFANWGSSATNIYAVSDSYFDGVALKMSYTGSGDRYIYSSEPDTGQSLANKAYSISFWAKASKDTTFQYFIQANGGNYEMVGTLTPAIGTGWQKFTTSGTFSASATATLARVVIRPSSDTTASITVDGARLEPGTNALSGTDGSFYQPADCGTPGSPQSFADQRDLTGGSARYKVQAFDAQGCASQEAYTAYVNGRPATITDLNVYSLTSQSANQLEFTTPTTLAGLSSYLIYAKNQATPLADLTGATLIGTTAPARTNSNNLTTITGTTAVSTPVNPNPSYPAANVSDGNTGTFWIGQANTVPNIVTLTFPSSVPVLKVSFSFPYAGYVAKNFTIETYNGSTWTVQTTVTGNASLTPSYTFARLVTTDKIRINITDTGYGITSYAPYMNEFMAYPGDSYVHDMHNPALPAQPGLSYAYAVIAVDANSIPSGMSSGPVTVKTIVDKDGPAKVSDLAVTTDIGTSQATLTWNTPPDNLGLGTGTGAVDYQIYRSPLSSTGTPVAVTDSNFSDTNNVALVYSGTYASSLAGTANTYNTTWYDHVGAYYAVRSKDSAGNWSPISNSPYIVVGKDVQAPAPPVIQSCTPKVSPEVLVAWSPAVDNACDTCGVNGYRLFRADVNIEPFLTDQCITENNIGQAQVAFNLLPYNYTAISDMGGEPGNTYYYALRAWDNENNLSNISNCAIATVATTAADTTPPTWAGTPLSVTQQPYPDIDLNWTPATDIDNSSNPGTVDHYNVYRSLATFSSTTDPGVTKIATVSGIRNSFIDSTGDHNTTYYYGTVAVDASTNHNASLLSNIGSATVAVAPSPDNANPAIPGTLAATTGVYPYINLSWTPSTDVDDAANPQPLLYYKLYRADYPAGVTDANKNNPSLVKTFIIAHDASEYTATGFGSAMYNYRLEAFDLAGNASGLSNEVTATVASAPCVDTTAPAAPVSLAAIVGPSPDMALSWTASTDSGSCAGLIDHYNLYKATYAITDTTDLRTITPTSVAGNSATFTDSTGAPNTTYWYVLTAVDSSGNESGKSNIITMTTAADSMAPAAITDLKASPSAGQVQLTWCKPSDNVGVSHYDIYRKEQGTILTDADIISANKVATFTNAGICLSYNDAGLTSGLTYSYAVIAVDGAGNRATISRGQAAGDTYATLP